MQRQQKQKQQQQQQQQEPSVPPSHDETSDQQTQQYTRRPALVDIGANLSHVCFKKDRGAVIEYARQEAGVEHAVLTTSSLKPHKDARRNFALCREHGFECTLGIHPCNAKSEFVDPETFRDAMGALLDGAPPDAVVAVGVTGLDYFRISSSNPTERAAEIEIQKACFEAHVALACKLRLPLFLHERSAHADFVQILDRFRDGYTGCLPVHGVVHCFTGTADEALAYVIRGLYVGLTGFVGMRDRGRVLRQTVLNEGIIPLELMMVGTDCPYMAPDGVRDLLVDPRRNEPVTLAATVDVIARELPGEVPYEQVANTTTQNAWRVFGMH
jgi:TatD DNase family protein